MEHGFNEFIFIHFIWDLICILHFRSAIYGFGVESLDLYLSFDIILWIFYIFITLTIWTSLTI